MCASLISNYYYYEENKEIELKEFDQKNVHKFTIEISNNYIKEDFEVKK
jgi:uncharacterized membrane protein